LLVARNSLAAVESVRPFESDAERDAFFDDAQAAATAAPPGEHVTFTMFSGDGQTYDQGAQASAGQLVTWVFIPLLRASGLFAMERALGTLRRLMVPPTRRSTFLLGSISGQFLMALVQMGLLIIFGIYVMNVPWGRDPLAL